MASLDGSSMLSECAKQKEWMSWLHVGLWTMVVYVTVPFARAIQQFVTEHCGGKQTFTWIAIIGIGAGGILMIAQIAGRWKRTAWRNLLWIVAIGAVFVYRVIQLRDAPVEAIHFLEYAFLGFLLYRALLHRIPDPMIFAVAIAIGAMIGTVDEIVQWITPRRIWDWRDVWFNGSSVCLMQAVIAFGLSPVVSHQRIRFSSVRGACRVSIGMALLCGLCLANTPDRVARYAAVIPGLGFLQRNASIMTEYGYFHTDPQIGKFKSRFSLKELARIDRIRGKEAAAILDRYRQPSKYKECLKDYPSHVDPLVYEARIHLRSMFHHIGILWPRSWDVPMIEDMDEAQKRFHSTRGYKEYLIISKYFPVTYSHSHYAPRDSQIEAMGQKTHEDEPFVSKVSRELITILSENQLRAGLLVLIFVLAGIDLLLGQYDRQDTFQKSPNNESAPVS